MSNILVRSLTGAVFISVILFPLFWDDLVAAGVLSVFMILGLIEFYKFFNNSDSISVNWTLVKRNITLAVECFKSENLGFRAIQIKLFHLLLIWNTQSNFDIYRIFKLRYINFKFNQSIIMERSYLLSFGCVILLIIYLVYLAQSSVPHNDSLKIVKLNSAEIYSEFIHYSDYLIGINPVSNLIQLVDTINSNEIEWKQFETNWKNQHSKNIGSTQWHNTRNHIFNISSKLTQNDKILAILDNALLDWIDSLDRYQYPDKYKYESIKSSVLVVSNIISKLDPN